MGTPKVGVTLERETLKEIDRWVRAGQFPSGRVIQTALAEVTARHKRQRLIRELAKARSSGGASSGRGIVLRRYFLARILRGEI
jgi:Arc/MetJ-type ribon-helix-helix transcriptional regulator